MKKLKKLFLSCLLAGSLFGCNNSAVIQSPVLNDNTSGIEASSTDKTFHNKFLCVTLATGGDSEIIKILNLQTRELTSLPVPGSVQGMSGDTENDLVYVNSKSSDGSSYSLYKIDIKNKQISRILSFSQLGIKPTYFLVSNNIVYVTGKLNGTGAFYGNDLIKNQWFAVGSNISAGKIEYGFNADTYHVISFDEQAVTKTVVDVKLKQIISKKTITHDIPFGNNVFIPSPHGLFVYVLHQLQDSFIPYAFNVKEGTVNKFTEVSTAGGLLYSAIVSNDGKHLFTNVNREIYHYKLEGDKLTPQPKVVLNIPESRNMAMAADNHTLYITHETGASLSVVTFNTDLSGYTVNNMYIGGSSNQVYLF